MKEFWYFVNAFLIRLPHCCCNGRNASRCKATGQAVDSFASGVLSHSSLACAKHDQFGAGAIDILQFRKSDYWILHIQDRLSICLVGTCMRKNIDNVISLENNLQTLDGMVKNKERPAELMKLVHLDIHHRMQNIYSLKIKQPK